MSKATKSDAIGYHDPGMLNNTFYSFGAGHTNIRDQLNHSPASDYYEKTIGYQPKYSELLNKTMTDVAMNTLVSRPQNLVKQPNCLMNDYTKNIS